LNLSGDKENTDPSLLRGEAVDENFALEVQGIDSKAALFRLKQYEMVNAYIFGNWELVSKALVFIKKNEKTLTGIYPTDFSYTWVAICSYNMFFETGNIKYKRDGQRAHRKVKNLADSGTELLVAPSLLLGAMASLCEKKVSIIQVEAEFNVAITACGDASYTLFEALGNERLANHFLTSGLYQQKGIEYIERAIEIYRRWGALKKVNWLESVYFTSIKASISSDLS
jgi:hypothetical protein